MANEYVNVCQLVKVMSIICDVGNMCVYNYFNT